MRSGMLVPAARNVRPITSGGMRTVSPATFAHQTIRYEYAAIQKIEPMNVTAKNFFPVRKRTNWPRKRGSSPSFPPYPVKRISCLNRIPFISFGKLRVCRFSFFLSLSFISSFSFLWSVFARTSNLEYRGELSWERRLSWGWFKERESICKVPRPRLCIATIEI